MGWLESLKLGGARCCRYVSSARYLVLLFSCFTAFFSVYSVLLLGFWSFFSLFSQTSLRLNSVFCLYSWLLAIRFHAYSVPLPPLSIPLLQLRLEFPVRRQHEHSRSGHVSLSKQRQPARQFVSSFTSWMHFSSTVVVNGFQIPLEHNLIPYRFHFFPLGTIAAVRFGSLDPTSFARLVRLTYSTDNDDQRQFSLTSTATRRLLSGITPLHPKSFTI